jgi:MurNAc alpha-1-phosphate uridylyltransferase
MSAAPLTTAMVFAAGFGTRMRPLTNTMPKPLIKVRGKALLDYVLDDLARGGITKAVVNVHYLADQIEAHVSGRTEPQIILSDERALLLDQGGGIKKALPHLGSEPFIIANTDAFWIEGATNNLQRLRERWNPQIMDALLLVAPVSTSVGVDWSGDFHMDQTGRLTKRVEGETAAFVYSGVGIMKPDVFATDSRDVFRLAPFLFDAAAQGRLYGVALDGQWLHVGTPEAVSEAETALAKAAR